MNPVLIIGGGISGITSALELAEAGKKVVLVERSPWLGGNVGKMNNYFPKLCPPACGLEINYRRIRSNPRIRVLTNTEVISLDGEKGNFKAIIKFRPTMVSDNCTACGDCVDACPEERLNEYNAGIGSTKAIFLQHPLAYPQKYYIDPISCIGESCGKCMKACQYDAIDLSSLEREETISASSVIIATGWNSYPADNIQEFNYTLSQDIVTNMEFERLLSVTGPFQGSLKRPSDGKQPISVAFVQCAGSRDRNHLPYCSAVCCSASLKHALNTIDSLPEASVTIFYIDLRVTGRNEDFLNRVQEEKRIRLIKGKVGQIELDKDQSKLIIEAEDIHQGRKLQEAFDLVVLATGIVPNKKIPPLQVCKEGFYLAAQENGMIPVSCSKKPMDVANSVKDATSAALKAMSITP